MTGLSKAVNFKEGAEDFQKLSETYRLLTRRKPKRFVPKRRGWTRKKQVECAEKQLEEHWEQMKLWGEICQNLAFVCEGLNRLQEFIKTSVLFASIDKPIKEI